jgi:hypothetical protein
MPSRAKTQRMAVSGTAAFDNPADYQAAIGGACVNLTVTGGGDFMASLTWLNLRYLRVVRGGENVPRIAYISLPPERAVVFFRPARNRRSGAGVNCGLVTSYFVAAVRERITGRPGRANGV